MHTRQSGAAHVPIMFFLILLVIFLGTLGFAYVTFTERNKLREEKVTTQQELQQAQARRILVEDYIADIGRVINKPGEYKGRPQKQAQYEGEVLQAEGLMNPDEVQVILEEACRAAGVSNSNGLENVLGSMVSLINSKNQRIADIEAERDKALNDSQEMSRRFSQLQNETESKSREWNQQLDQARTDYNSHLQEKDNTITNLQTNLQNKDLQLIQEREAWVEEKGGLQRDIANLQMHNWALAEREKLRQPPNRADGKIIAAQTLVRTAFINLGKKDLLQPDTMFRIKSPGSDKVKAYARVTRVEGERAEVELTGIVDPVGDYVREGDEIFNDLYTPGMSRTIYLMGRFSAPYNKDVLASLLTRLGNRVVNKMAPGVDTVIIGNNLPNEEGSGFVPIEESEDYKLATYLGVELAPLIKIRDLVAPTY